MGGFSMMVNILTNHTKVIVYLVMLITMILPLSVVRAEGTSENTPVKQDTSSLTHVDSKYVCMVNDQVFNKEQIPVEVQGKTYYGCCEMCKARLKTDPNSRTATDPVSGKQVDKALAVIGATPDGNVYYFESEANLRKYATNKREQKN
jgi:YHS domain-containing protein